MYILLALIGGGTEEDPYRVPLPTYRMIDVDYAAMRAHVEVPDADWPEALAVPEQPVKANGVLTPVSVSLSAEDMAAWYALLDVKYAEHRAEFRPEIAQNGAVSILPNG